jgi:Uncharacterized protein conserved in bacteria (DUF2147)
MILQQKLTSFAVKTIVTAPFIASIILVASIEPTTANAEIESETAIDGRKISQTEAVPAFVGRTWQNERKLQVKFYKTNNTYSGKIVSLPEGAETKDVKNPDPKLRSRNLIGSIMFQGFTYDPAKKQLTGGVLYIPEMGRMMKPTLTIASDDRIDMKVSMGIMSRTVTLTEVK